MNWEALSYVFLGIVMVTFLVEKHGKKDSFLELSVLPEISEKHGPFRSLLDS